ncbi:hypothetical protein GUITHDRAFT_134075 [Guillardia theta CCMP2712]|uniref:Uncharacterized protein n=1 Tax=Guillardia theta (strain CCMP2712) TaxID=905079 RepID=L1JU25_GUITC|nr:hypothetical protein GUITHDRAFT_134075 [Guillardia theta CCMP2712]EKX51705.1 hypothetical protein GUITHDRAFT_134075 [Guillardia theta CCMP2712]|eukprot:XP_005838685.1 hypothetical protein GUITHDRAFT_134075 [Guillardia theta CCMP2712]
MDGSRVKVFYSFSNNVTERDHYEISLNVENTIAHHARCDEHLGTVEISFQDISYLAESVNLSSSIILIENVSTFEVGVGSFLQINQEIVQIGDVVSKILPPDLGIIIAFNLFNPSQVVTNQSQITIKATAPLRSIEVDSFGRGYIDGSVLLYGGDGYGASAVFSVFPNGSIGATEITNVGHGFTLAPNATLEYFKGSLTSSATSYDQILNVSNLLQCNFVVGALLVAVSGLTEEYKVHWLCFILKMLNIRVLGGCDPAVCSQAYAIFEVDTNGSVTNIEIYDHGAGYLRDPADDYDPTYKPYVIEVLYADSGSIQMNSISDLQILGSNMTGCSAGIHIYALSGGGYRFDAVVSAAQDGAITAITVLDHGVGYQQDPDLVSDDSACKCNGRDSSITGVLNECLKVWVTGMNRPNL